MKRVFITDDAEILPRYLRFVHGLVDSADLPLNVSREKIQESPLLAAIRKGSTSRVLTELERLADKEAQTYTKIWDTFGAVLKEGLYEDFERRDALLNLARFRTTAAADEWRSLKDYVGAFKTNQTAIYYVAGEDIERLKSSPQLEGFHARGIEVLLLSDPSRQFLESAVGYVVRWQAWFKSVTQGAADLAAHCASVDAGAGGECRGGGQELGQRLCRLPEVDARRRGLRCPRLGPADRQRGMPDGA